MLIVVIYIIPEGRAAGSFQFLNLHHYMGITAIAATVVISIIVGVIAKKVYNKQFANAGIM